MKLWKGNRYLEYRKGDIMGRFKKRDLIKIICVLEENNNRVLRCFDEEVPITVEELAKCQDSAILLGNILENYEKTGKTIASHLENYCEYIYQMSLMLGAANQRRKIAKKVQNQLYSIKKMIQYDLPEDRLQMVFLPYKAAMWDSLESIWKAASDDDGVDAIVIPIPYFDKNSDGSLGQMHYEGDLYPDYVPITSWKDYIISDWKPDVIFIHNPYDECNYVTSVHPDFYAERLRVYTNMLVYVPYFIAVNDSVEEHFCIAPGVIYANKVIVQSEEVRQTYLKELHKFEEENHCKDCFGRLEEKIISLGSPKLDKALDILEQNFVLPDGWTKLIMGNGKKKKVILYNTSVEALLKHTWQMLKKIRSVLEYFEQIQEVVLLWRPHPLLKQTLSSMHPELLGEYLEMESKYKEAGWGIYDTSSELYRAIAVSDAYYGDVSSVIELYKRIGKPIMIQNVDIIN